MAEPAGSCRSGATGCQKEVIWEEKPKLRFKKSSRRPMDPFVSSLFGAQVSPPSAAVSSYPSERKLAVFAADAFLIKDVNI